MGDFLPYTDRWGEEREDRMWRRREEEALPSQVWDAQQTRWPLPPGRVLATSLDACNMTCDKVLADSALATLQCCWTGMMPYISDPTGLFQASPTHQMANYSSLWPLSPCKGHRTLAQRVSIMWLKGVYFKEFLGYQGFNLPQSRWIFNLGLSKNTRLFMMQHCTKYMYIERNQRQSVLCDHMRVQMGPDLWVLQNILYLGQIFFALFFFLEKKKLSMECKGWPLHF